MRPAAQNATATVTRLIAMASANCQAGTLETAMRAKNTNGERNGTKPATTLSSAFGCAIAYCATKNAPTTGRTIGVVTLPRSSVREISEAAAAYAVANCK